MNAKEGFSSSEKEVSNIQTSFSGTEQRALKLLGAGWGPELVANTLGVSPGLISQMLAKEEFANEVQNLRFVALQKHSDHDTLLDKMEHQLAQNLSKSLPFIMKPQEQLRALEVLNRLKRKGSVDSGSEQPTAATVTLLMPTFVTQQFTTNINNQVIRAGEQTLETIQSGTLLRQAKEQIAKSQQLVIENSGKERNSNELTGFTEFRDPGIPEPVPIQTGDSPNDF